MKLEKIFIRNFRPVGEQGLELKIAPTSTTFIGENNVGKSSIFEAIKRVLEPEVEWDKEDWYAGVQSKTIEIQLEYILDNNQIKQIIKKLELPMEIEEFKENFTRQMTYGFTKTLGQSSFNLKLGEIQIEHSKGWIGEIDYEKGYNSFKWHEIITEYEKQNINLMEFIKQFIEEKKKSGLNPRIEFEYDIFNFLIEFVKQNLIIIEEFRGKPQKTLSDVLTSPTGRHLASVLFNLKNARPKQKKKFEQIRAQFRQLFPTLDLDVIKENDEIKILIQKAGIESTTFYIGAGILQSLLLLTHLIAHKNKVICVDHPELHLHPHAQRRLATFIEEGKDRQIILVTHSPYFVNINKDSNIIRFVQKSAQIKIFEPEQDYFINGDYFKLEQFLDIDTKELFFASKVILVEGPTELGALPIFASTMGYNLDENGVSIINVGGKHNFKFFVKLCKGFEIPHFIIADEDAEELLTNHKPKFILPTDFEGLLPNNLREEAKEKVGTSKPRIGRYVARKMVEEGKIPEEIKKIIENVKNL